MLWRQRGPSAGKFRLQPNVSASFERAGPNVKICEVDWTSRIVEARLADGDLIFIGRLPSLAVSGKAIQTVRTFGRNDGLGG